MVGEVYPRRDKDAFVTVEHLLPIVEIVPSSPLYGLVDVRKILWGGYRQKAKKINTGRGNLTQETQ